jgi:hypothetical protein
LFIHPQRPFSFPGVSGWSLNIEIPASVYITGNPLCVVSPPATETTALGVLRPHLIPNAVSCKIPLYCYCFSVYRSLEHSGGKLWLHFRVLLSNHLPLLWEGGGGQAVHMPAEGGQPRKAALSVGTLSPVA